MTINVHHHYTADVQTNRGTFTITLLPGVAPLAVNNFVFLARRHFYGGTIFHRIIKSFMVQTGDPTGTGSGGPGYKFKDEPVHLKYTVGTVAMANSGPNTNGSQFFIVTGSGGAGLAPSYTIFGRVSGGMNVVQKIASTPVQPNPGSGELSDPLDKVVMQRVTIRESA
jgi:cyclophilin family peptidyl-prolyl cis-trans isomerase